MLLTPLAQLAPDERAPGTVASLSRLGFRIDDEREPAHFVWAAGPASASKEASAWRERSPTMRAGGTTLKGGGCRHVLFQVRREDR